MYHPWPRCPPIFVSQQERHLLWQMVATCKMLSAHVRGASARKLRNKCLPVHRRSMLHAPLLLPEPCTSCCIQAAHCLWLTFFLASILTPRWPVSTEWLSGSVSIPASDEYRNWSRSKSTCKVATQRIESKSFCERQRVRIMNRAFCTLFQYIQLVLILFAVPCATSAVEQSISA